MCERSNKKKGFKKEKNRLHTVQNLHIGWNLVEWTKTGEMEQNWPKFRMKWNREVIHTGNMTMNKPLEL